MVDEKKLADKVVDRPDSDGFFNEHPWPEKFRVAQECFERIITLAQPKLAEDERTVADVESGKKHFEGNVNQLRKTRKQLVNLFHILESLIYGNEGYYLPDEEIIEFAKLTEKRWAGTASEEEKNRCDTLIYKAQGQT